MDWTKVQTLHLEPPDFKRFGALKLAYQVAEAGGTSGAVLNAANEAAVAAFMDNRIAFGEITGIVEHIISRHRIQESPSLDDLLAADRWARDMAETSIAARACAPLS
jgi:1-deoxy-D-xylulose-5-phosphate reductoisomerase